MSTIPVTITGATPEAVALALAHTIYAKEANHKDTVPDSGKMREYWLKLYAECLAAVRGPNQS